MDAIRLFTLLSGISAIQLTTGNFFNVTKHDSGPGLYYERVGEASIYVKDFNIITYYDLERYLVNRDNVMQYTKKVETLCKKSNNENCKIFLHLLNTSLENLEHKHELISDILQLPRAPTRRKRFWGQLLTTVVSGIFGVITNSQKTHAVTAEIQKYREQVEHTKTMLAHQMYIYQNLQQEVNNKFDKLSLDIRGLADELTNLSIRFNVGNTYLKMTNLLLYTSNLIYLFTTEQSDLLDCLILARQGILHPIIFSPRMLKEKLLEAHGKIENHDILKDALQTAADNSNIMFNMIKPVIYVNNLIMVFDFDVPLVTDSFYDIYKLTSAPVLISENIYAYIYPESPYLLEEKRDNRHFFLDVYEFGKCMHAGDKQYICKREKPLRKQKLTCEHMLIASGEAMPENCDVRLIKIDEALFIELERDGSWLFTAPSSESLHFYCDHQLRITSINGTGIIDVDANCWNTESDTIILRDFSTNNLNISQHFDIHTPKGDLKKYLEGVDLTYLKATMNIRVLSRTETVKLRDLGVSLSSITMRNELYTSASATEHNILLYIFCTLCCALIVFNVYMYISFKKTYEVSPLVLN